jgi:hypothetical protein
MFGFDLPSAGGAPRGRCVLARSTFDIIDNAHAIRRHDPGRWPKFRIGKSAILDRMAAMENGRLDRLPLFLDARATLA